jgi:hypothetical protein
MNDEVLEGYPEIEGKRVFHPRIASIGSILLAFNAGRKPAINPVRKLNIREKTTTLYENNMGISKSVSNVPPSARLSKIPAIPPKSVMITDSRRNERRIPLLDAP